MSPLESVAEVLAQVLEPSDVADRRALAEVLQEQLYQLMAVPDVSLEIRAQFGNPLEPGQLLTDWVRLRLAAVQTRELALTPLLPIAALLDSLAESETPLLAFVPWWFRVDERGRPLVFPPQLALARKQSGQTLLTERQRRAYARLVHPALLKTLTHFDVRSGLLYSFTLFLTRLIVNVDGDSKKQLLLRLRRCRRRDRTLPPELPDLLSDVLSRPLDRPPACACRQLVGQVLERVLSNPFVVRPALSRTISHELFAYSVFGLNKPDPVNEDRVLCHSRGPISFLLVADGVSLVDLGSGEMAAEEIIRCFRQSIQPVFDPLADRLRQQIEVDPGIAWPAEVERLLQDFFVQANHRVVALANQLLQGRPEEEAHRVGTPEAPLCTTLTVAVLVYDQALLAFLGDSPALLYRRATGRLSQLSTDDQLGMEEDYDPDSGLDPHALTRVIGQCLYNEEEHRLEPLDLPVPVVRVQLQPGDLLVLASDGLVDCINEPTAGDRFARLETELQRLHATDLPLKNLVRELIRLGEEGLSDDNITAAVVRIQGAAVLNGETPG